MFQVRCKAAFALLFLVPLLALSFLMTPTHTALASSPPNFALSASPTSQTIPRDQNALYTIHVQALNGFTGTVNFSFVGHINHSAASFSPTSVTGTGNTTFDIFAGEDAPEGTFTFTLTGTSGSLQHSLNVTVVISDNAPDFTLSANPIARTVKRGQTTTFDIHVQDINGFNGTVTFTIDSGPTNDKLFFTSSSVTGTGDTTFEVQTNAQSALGTFTVTLIADSGGLEHRIQVNYTVTA
ncbi:MAG TPA: hypothetical protein VFB60_19650 [Ktedonobacteraceae bacterium]|nr:hypothetical protein [Ktedonobacteraceae bacterium]